MLIDYLLYARHYAKELSYLTLTHLSDVGTILDLKKLGHREVN